MGETMHFLTHMFFVRILLGQSTSRLSGTPRYESLTMDPMQATGFSKSFYQKTISEALQVGNQHHNQQFALGISSV